MITIALIAYQRQRSMKNGNQPIRSAATKNRFGGVLKCWSDDSGRQSYASMCVCAFLKAIRGTILRTKKKTTSKFIKLCWSPKSASFRVMIGSRRYFSTDKRLKFVRKESVRLATSFASLERDQKKGGRPLRPIVSWLHRLIHFCFDARKSATKMNRPPKFRQKHIYER